MDTFAFLFPLDGMIMDETTVDISYQALTDLFGDIAVDLNILQDQFGDRIQEMTSFKVHRMLGSPAFYNTGIIDSLRSMSTRYSNLDNTHINRIERVNDELGVALKDGTTYNIKPSGGKKLLEPQLDALAGMGIGMNRLYRGRYGHEELEMKACNDLFDIIDEHELDYRMRIDQLEF